MERKVSRLLEEKERLRRSLSEEHAADPCPKNTSFTLSSNYLEVFRSKSLACSKQIKLDMQELKNKISDESAEKNSSTISTATLNSNGVPQLLNIANQCGLIHEQLKGFCNLISLFENGVPGIMTAVKGSKSLHQVMAFLLYLHSMKVLGPILVVVPLAAVPTWLGEFHKWLPQMPVIRFPGTCLERDITIRGLVQYKYGKEFPIMIMSHEAAIQDQCKLSKLGIFTYTIIDAGRNWKNNGLPIFQRLKKIQTVNKLLLIKEPMQDDLLELIDLANFVVPPQRSNNKIGNEQAIFLKQHSKLIVSELRRSLRPFVICSNKTEDSKAMLNQQ